MKKFVLVFGVLCSVMAVMAEVKDDFNATVTATKLNVRIKPTIKAPKAGTLLKGERVRITAEENSWFEIEAPESLKLYVSEVYLVNGKLTNSVNLRTGRDAKSPSFGLLPAGTELKAVEENSKFGWIRVKAPAGIKVYAYKDYISPDAKESKEEVNTAEAAPEKKAEAAKVEEKKAETVKAEEFIEAAPAPEKKAEVKKAAPVKAEAVKAEEKKAAPAPEKKEEVKKAAPAPEKKAEAVKVEEKKPAAPDTDKIEADLKSLGAKFDKDGVNVKGILYNIPKSTTPATNYAVLKGSENQGFVCGLDDKEFKKLEGKEVDFTGKAFRIPGWKAPIIIVK